MKRKESRKNTIKVKGSIARIGHRSHVKWDNLRKNSKIIDKLYQHAEHLERELCK
jgi:hypothetical protein